MLIKKQEIDKPILHFFKILAKVIKLLLRDFDIGFHLNISRAILIIKEPPASGLEQLVDLYSCLCFLCAHKTRIPLSKLTRLKGRFSVFVPPMQDGRSARLLSKRYEFDFSRTPSSYIGRGFFILRFSLTGQMPA